MEKAEGMIVSVPWNGEACDMKPKSHNGRRAGNPETPAAFGQRLAEIRKARGYSQEQLAGEIGISQRMLCYYEAQAERPPAHLLPALARVLDVSTDELLGLKEVKDATPRRSSRIWRKLRAVESLPPKDQKQVLDIIDALVTRQRIRENVQ